MVARTKRRGAKGRSKAKQKKQARTPFRTKVGHTLRTAKERIRERLGRQTDDVWGVVLVVISGLIVLSFFDLSGPVGAAAGDSLRFLFGVGA